MKKIFVCCIFAGFMSVVTMPFAHAVATVGDKCNSGGFDLVDGARQLVNCATYSLSNASECYVYCKDGNLIYGIGTCNPGFYRLEPHSVPSDLYQQCASKAAACESSGAPARWNDTYCDCGDNRYEWNDVTMRCENTDEYEACINANDTTWNAKLGLCQCVDSIHYQWNGSQCVALPGEAECNGFASSRDFQGDVEWDPLRHICKCIEDPDGNTIANPDDWTVNVFGDACEKKPEVQRREQFAANQPAADEKLRAIQEKISELNGISDDWYRNRSHWKNADGKFNTARLASDSVAGVVLGTVGGVITSNVIKKNQVKGGFEDINCVIGGQRVAGFADQFNVGIQQ
ncbi:MAG: hypothetical protein K2M34_00505 [Alphaproteobacteria bacterium]|nr:hypothetical protein [Alphaproteobacteria bacterium]